MPTKKKTNKNKKTGLCACTELKYRSILYVILEKSLLLVIKKPFLAKLGLFSVMAPKKPDQTVKNGIFLAKIWYSKG